MLHFCRNSRGCRAKFADLHITTACLIPRDSDGPLAEVGACKVPTPARAAIQRVIQFYQAVVWTAPYVSFAASACFHWHFICFLYAAIKLSKYHDTVWSGLVFIYNFGSLPQEDDDEEEFLDSPPAAAAAPQQPPPADRVPLGMFRGVREPPVFNYGGLDQADADLQQIRDWTAQRSAAGVSTAIQCPGCSRFQEGGLPNHESG